MNKEELVRELGKRLDITQKDVSIIIDEFSKLFNEVVLRGEMLKIIGMFSIRLKPFPPFKYRDFKTGEITSGDPYYKVDFRLNEKLAEEISKKKLDAIDLDEVGLSPRYYEEKKGGKQ